MLLNLTFILMATLLFVPLAKGLIAATSTLRSDREMEQLRAYLDWKPDQAKR